jgi:sulfate/thiosulfate transport system permease protein
MNTMLKKMKRPSVIPGFGITISFTIAYLFLIVIIPLSGIFFKAATLTFDQFYAVISDPRLIHAYKVSFGSSLLAAFINVIFGTILCWVLVRYEFPGKKLLDAIVDIPFALPTAVAGIALTAIYSPNGWVGKYLEPYGIKVAYSQIGIIIALTFVGLPFIVRTLQPILEDLDKEVEEAATSLGATRWQIFTRIIIPYIMPALLTGFAMAFARALGEYGSVIFIAGNVPYISEIVPLMIVIKLEQFDYAGATSIAVVMLVISFILLLFINYLQKWSQIRIEK